MIELRPVVPAAARGAVRDVFERARTALGLSWVPSLFQAFAMYPAYLARAWEAVESRVETTRFRVETDGLARLAGEVAGSWRPTFAWHGDRARAAWVLDGLVDGGGRLAALAAAYRLALDGDIAPPAPLADVADRPPRGADGPATLVVRPEEASAPLRAVYAEVERGLGVPVVPVEVQALGALAGLLDAAWPDVATALAGASCRDGEAALGTAALDAARRVGVARPLDRATLRAHADLDAASLANLSALVHMFARVQPTLLLVCAMLRRGL